MPRPSYFVTDVGALDERRLELTSDDGTRGDVDLSRLYACGGVFPPLGQPASCRRVRVDPERGTIVWPDGADVAAEPLRAQETPGSAYLS